MFIHTRLSAPNMFAKFVCQTRGFRNKKEKNGLPNLGQTDYKCDGEIHNIQEATKIPSTNISHYLIFYRNRETEPLRKYNIC